MFTSDHHNGIRKMAGICLDILASTILIKQFLIILRLSHQYSSIRWWLIDLGLVGGLSFLFLVRLALFHAFQRAWQSGQSITIQGQTWTVETVYLLFTIITNDHNREMGCLWNLKGVMGQQIDQVWTVSSVILPWLIDSFFGILAIVPLFVVAYWYSPWLSLFATSAISGAIYLVLLLSAQIGIITWWRDDAQEVNQEILYQGLFIRITRLKDNEHVHISLNIGI